MFKSLYPASFREELTAVWRLDCRGDIEGAITAAMQVMERARTSRDATAEACATAQLAWFCFQRGDVEKGLEHASTSQRIWKALSSERGQAVASALVAWLMLESGLTDDATDQAIKALAHAERDADVEVLGLATNVLGVVFWYCQQIERALALCEQAVRLAQQGNDAVVLAWWRINLGGVHGEIGYRAQRLGDMALHQSALATAIAITEDALNGAYLTGDIWGQHLCLCNNAEYLTSAGRISEAFDRLDRCDQLPAPPSQRSLTHRAYARVGVLTQAGRHREALPIGIAVLAAAEASGSIDEKVHAYRYMSDIYEGFGEFDRALDCFKKFHNATLLLATENTQRRARIAELRYENDKLRLMAEAAEQRAATLTRTTRIDPLTGLANRRVLDDIQSTFEARQRSYAIAMVDLDYFKAINDRFSHLVGDEVLRRVATLLMETCRNDDLAIRMGGEEFCLVIGGVDLAEAERVCQSLQTRLADVRWHHIAPQLAVTASIGVAASCEGAHHLAVLTLADQRLYLAKNTGRDKIVTQAGPSLHNALVRLSL